MNFSEDKLTKVQFVDAAKLIHEKGLVKGKYSKGEKHCTLGALGAQINYPTGPGPHRFPDGLYDSNIRVDIMNFNDNKTTTKEDVETLLLLLGEMAEN